MEGGMFLIFILMQGVEISSTNLYGSLMALDELQSTYCLQPSCTNNTTMTDTMEDSVLSTSSLYSCCPPPCSCEQDCVSFNSCCLEKIGQILTTQDSDIEGGKFFDKRAEHIVHLYKQKVESEGLGEDLSSMADIWLRGTCSETTIFAGLQTGQSMVTFFMVTSCPPDYPRYTEEYIGCDLENITEHDLSLYVPVTSSKTLIVYRNKHCLACNEDNSTMNPWQTELHCHKNSLATLPHLTTVNDILPFVSDQTECYISFQPPQWISDILYLCDNIQISTCNVTGLWTGYDPSIEAACTAYTSIFMASIKEFSNYSMTFSNIACYLCNIGRDGISEDTCILSEFSPENHTTSVALNTGVDTSNYVIGSDFPKVILSQSEPDECGEGKLLDNSTGKCRETYCPRDHATNDDYCSPLFDDIRGMTVGVKLKMKFQRYFFATILSDMDQSVAMAFNDFFFQHGIKVCHASLWHKFKDDNKKELDFYFYHVVLQTGGHTLYSHIWYILSILLERNPFGEIPDLTGKMSVGYQVTFGDDIVIVTTNGLTKVFDGLDDKQLFAAPFDAQYSENKCGVSISMGSTSFCERVALNKEEYDIKGENLMLKHSLQTIHSAYFDVSLDHKAFICVDEYKKRNSMVTDNTDISGIEKINQNYFTDTVSTNTSIYLGIIVTTVSICSVFLAAGLARKRCFPVQLPQQISIDAPAEELQEIA